MRRALVSPVNAAAEMLKPLVALFTILFAGHALAEDCPRFHRFVDFGIEGEDWVIYRGGPAFRVEGFDGHLLVLSSGIQCLTVRDVLADGHGNPIPMVASIDYDPARTGSDLIALRVAKAEDLRMAAEESAAAHRAALKQAGAVETLGESWLCVRREGVGDTSCQVVSPYPGNTPLVIYCDAAICRMPFMALVYDIFAAAEWVSGPSFTGGMAGLEIIKRVEAIHEFLNPLSASLSLG